MKNPANWFTLYVRDLARAKAFYEAVFQIELTDLPVEGTEARYATFPGDNSAPGCGGMLCHDPQQPFTPGNSVLLYFACDDCAIEAARAAQHGGKVLTGKTAIGNDYGFDALIEDSEGNRIGLHSPA